MALLAVDVGGAHVTVRVETNDEERRFTSGPRLSAQRMIDKLLPLVDDWQFDRVRIGVPAHSPGRPRS